MHSRALPSAAVALIAILLVAPRAHAQPVMPGFTHFGVAIASRL